MAFDAAELAVLAYANGFTLWHYRTERTATVLEPGYFSAAEELLRRGDRIMVNGDAGMIDVLVTDAGKGVVVEQIAATPRAA